jgi:predicted NBD/HSP70 family sugar kinase
MVYVKFATGIGAGILLGGRLYRGASGIAGEIGHVIVDPDGVVCRCGNRGCLETVAAAPALVDLLRRSYGADFSTAEMLAGSAVGNVACHRVMADAGRAIGRALADLVTCLNPSLIVVGCHPDAAAEPLLNGIREAIGRYALPAAVQAVSVAARSRRGARRAARSPGPRDFPNHQPTNHDGMTTVKEEEL